MRVARWCWMLVLAVVIAGCLPSATPDWPASFTEHYGGADRGQSTFTTQAPPIGQTGQDVVGALRGAPSTPMFLTRAVPVFGVIDCAGIPDCQPGPGGFQGGPARAVWVVLYPDWVGPGGDAGWALVDAVAGVDAGYEYTDPRGR